MGHGSSFGTCHWACMWWLFGTSQGMEMGVLASYDAGDESSSPFLTIFADFETGRRCYSRRLHFST